MATVRLLPDHVANQIAAGEVIERPASVIKELVENSIDAGATRIEVEFRKGGTSLMRIEDNGGGMSRDDALLSLERHATSKIQKVKDLDKLATMGFRGEALPSIASVSRFQLQTREAESEGGTEVLVDGGKTIHVRDCGMPQGTRMTVSKLFNTVPVRRKFLKSVTTESAHIVHCVRLYALAHPEIGFTLIDDGRILFESPACDSLKNRVAEIFGKQLVSGLIEVDAAEEGMRLRGLIGKPSVSRSSRHEMLFFVNNRPIENKTLSYALVESYYGHIPKGRYPVAFLFFEIAPERVDVNVHPAKREIRFREEAKVRGFAVRSLLEALRKETVSLREIKPVEVRREPVLPKRMVEAVEAVPERLSSPAKCRQIADTKETPKISPTANEERRAPTHASPEPATRHSPHRDDSSSASHDRWKYLGWAMSEFALFDTGVGVALLDVRAARQRVFYEGLLRDFGKKEASCQRLLIPQPVELDPLSAASLEENVDFFGKLGFEIAPFGRNFFRIEGTPTWLDETQAEAFLKETVGGLRQGSLSNEKQELILEQVARKAVAQVRRPRNAPSEEEVRSLLKELFSCEKPMTEPSGKPTLVELSSGEIAKRFMRKNRPSTDDLF